MTKSIAERNLDLVMTLTRFILDQPRVLDRLPPDFRLVLLPDDDPELSRYNFDLLAQQPESEQPVVFVRLKLHPLNLQMRPPQVYVPVPA
jgi:hypothetical protein